MSATISPTQTMSMRTQTMSMRRHDDEQQHPSETSSECDIRTFYDYANKINKDTESLNNNGRLNSAYPSLYRPSPLMPPPMTVVPSPLKSHKNNHGPRSNVCDSVSPNHSGNRSFSGFSRRHSMGGPPPHPTRYHATSSTPTITNGYAQRRFSSTSIGIENFAPPGVVSHPPAASSPPPSGGYFVGEVALQSAGGEPNNANTKIYHRSVSAGSHIHLHSHAPSPASGNSCQSGSSGGGYDDHNVMKSSETYGSNVEALSYRPRSRIMKPHPAAQNDNNVNKPTSDNPFRKPSKSFLANDLVFVLSTLLFLTIVTLFPATLYCRNTYNSLQDQLETARQVAGNIKHRRPHANQQIHGIPQQQKELSSLENDVAGLTKQRDHLESQIDHLESQYQKFATQLQTKINLAERMRESLIHEIGVHNIALDRSQREMEKYKAMVFGRKELETFVMNREGVLWEKIDDLKVQVTKFSHREGVDWYGEGPHQVEITLEYPQHTPGQDISKWPRTTKPFIVELAPLSIMPHTVTFFLSQVYHKLWNGVRLHRNLQHIYQFAPAPHINESGLITPSVESQRFQDRKLDKVIFQEYHSDYPHEAWTLGFSGRPGGTEFYINKLNNSVIHGPGGQPDDVHADVDPCFGKVVDGKDVFDEIDKIPDDSLIQGVVVILSIRPLFQERNPVDEKMKKKMETLGVGRDGMLQWFSK